MKATREFCRHDWVDLEGGSGGMTVFTDGVHGAKVAALGRFTAPLEAREPLAAGLGEAAL